MVGAAVRGKPHGFRYFRADVILASRVGGLEA